MLTRGESWMTGRRESILTSLSLTKGIVGENYIPLPGTDDPEESVTRPVIVADVSCPVNIEGQRVDKARNNTAQRGFMAPPNRRVVKPRESRGRLHCDK